MKILLVCFKCVPQNCHSAPIRKTIEQKTITFNVLSSAHYRFSLLYYYVAQWSPINRSVGRLVPGRRERINRLFYFRYIDDHTQRVVLFWKSDSLSITSVCSSWRAWHVPVSVTGYPKENKPSSQLKLLENKRLRRATLQRNNEKAQWWDGRRGRWTTVLKLADKVAELQLWGRRLDTCWWLQMTVALKYVTISYSVDWRKENTLGVFALWCKNVISA